MYTVRHPLSRDILLGIFDMFRRPLGWSCSYCAAQLVARMSERKKPKHCDWEDDADCTESAVSLDTLVGLT